MLSLRASAVYNKYSLWIQLMVTLPHRTSEKLLFMKVEPSEVLRLEQRVE
jgi:hypothetical protein